MKLDFLFLIFLAAYDLTSRPKMSNNFSRVYFCPPILGAIAYNITHNTLLITLLNHTLSISQGAWPLASSQNY